MTDFAKKYERLKEQVAQDIPGFKIRYKDESFVMKLLAVLVWAFCPDFMERFTTTLGNTVYYPNRAYEANKNYETAFEILAHEYQHLYDAKIVGQIRSGIDYLEPQVFAVFSLIALQAIWDSRGFGALVFLIALLPWPSNGRRNIEFRGYAMSLAVDFWRFGNIHPVTKEWVKDIFKGSSYYFMWPFPKRIGEDVEKLEEDLRHGTMNTGKLLTSPPFENVRRILTTEQ